MNLKNSYASLEKEVDRLLALKVEPGGPGAAVAIVSQGEFVVRKAYGLADLEWGIPLSVDAVFRIASLTKQFTAVAIMMLAERGALSIDDPIERHLGKWPRGSQTVTVRCLLNHTSGVWRHDSELVERTLRPNPPVEEVLDLIFSRPLEFDPGERYSYNNSGYLLLGAIIAAASARSYEAFLREEIFEPLGMDDTRVLTHETITPFRARGYIRGRKRFHNARLDAMNWSHAAGALGSTLTDLVKWDRAIRGNRLIGAESHAAMLADTPLADGSHYPYGFGWGTADYRGARVYHHAGGISGYACQMLHFRDEDLTTIVLSNLYLFAFDKVTRGLIRAFKGVAEPIVAEPSAQQMAACAGAYEGEWPFVIAENDAGLGARGEHILCQRGDPEVEYRFSELSDGRYQRVDYASPLWPISSVRRAVTA
ncbi:MAG TPA: serine hydrolase domain-containing protein [Caulobacteraceae bacterium]